MNKFIFVLLMCCFTIPVFAQELKVMELTCQYRVNPLGIQTLTPSLSWKLQSKAHNVVQEAYQILVADNLNDLEKNVGNIWNSKKVTTRQSIHINYQGKTLQAAKSYYWKVKVWDNHQNIKWSTSARWQMALLNPSDWKGAKWIAYEKIADSNVNIQPTDGKKDAFKENNVLPMFRKSFSITKPIRKATLFISGLGHFEASLNGNKIGDHFLDPGWTKYDKEALYIAFDLTENLIPGENVLGVMLGNGFYYVPPVSSRYRKLKVAFGYPKMICRLALVYQDGSTAEVISNQTWKTAPSPITFSSIFGGEDYNANLEQQGWNKTKFNASKWKFALLVDGPKLNVQKEEPVQVFDHFSAKAVSKLTNGDYVFDLGQNASGIVELEVNGKKGDTVKIVPAELIKADGSVNQRPIGSPVYFTYILKGDVNETWRPRFTYYGFRYLQVKGAVPKGKANPLQLPIIAELKGLHVRNAAAKVGSFSCSNPLFNQTFELINWAIKSNMVSLFTDCPHREKLGWLEELHLMGSSVRYNFDVAPLFRKGLQDMKNSQTADGLIPEIAPEYVKFEWGGGIFRDSPEWGSSAIIMPWYLYQWYGDKDALTTSYTMMQAYLNYLNSKAKDNILSQGLGDWYDLGPNPPGVAQLTPMGITGTAIYHYDLLILEKTARILGKVADAERYQKLSNKVKKSFNDKFFNAKTKQYGSGSQAANAMAIYMQLVDPIDKEAVLANLIKDIKSRNNGLTAGDIGYRYVLRVLEAEGRSDVIFDMNSRSDVPGYGMQLAKGATALTESWAGLSSVSNNHFMLGHLMEWFYSGVGGIRQAADGIAFNQINIYPEVVGDLTFAKASYDSPYGLITTNWTKSATFFELEVTIPVNTNAVVYLPNLERKYITEVNKNEFKVLGMENGRTKVAIGSGEYKFSVR
jgi:alpha-L-rhamnosidase